MQELAVSMMKFSAAMTMFGIQQVQNAVGAITDSQGATDKFKHALDSVTKALSSELDQSNKSAQSSMNELGEKLVDRAASALDMPAMDPRNVMKAAADVLKKTTDSVTDLVEKTASVTEAAIRPDSAARHSSEPKLAAETLGLKK
jgi:hypothetical protein